MSRHCGKQSDGVVAAMRDGGRYVWRLMTAFIYIGFLVGYLRWKGQQSSIIRQYTAGVEI